MTVSYDDDSYFVNENMSCYEFEFLKGCIKKLKVDDQEILYLKFSCGLEYSEISKRLALHLPQQENVCSMPKTD